MNTRMAKMAKFMAFFLLGLLHLGVSIARATETAGLL